MELCKAMFQGDAFEIQFLFGLSQASLLPLSSSSEKLPRSSVFMVQYLSFVLFFFCLLLFSIIQACRQRASHIPTFPPSFFPPPPFLPVFYNDIALQLQSRFQHCAIYMCHGIVSVTMEENISLSVTFLLYLISFLFPAVNAMLSEYRNNIHFF